MNKKSELILLKSAKFGEIQADIYQKDNEPYMTAKQLGDCLQYKEPLIAINKLVNRNEYLKSEDFSVLTSLVSTDGKRYNTRIFNEDGIYEITMLAKTEKAKEFRAWVRRILKSLRSGKAKLVGMTDYQRMMAETRAENARIRKAQILTRLADQYQGSYKQVLNSYATKELTGEHLLPLPMLPERTFSATELGEMFGISANKIGILTNRHQLKTEQYGRWFNDKAKGHNKEIQSFRYFSSVIPKLSNLLKEETR